VLLSESTGQVVLGSGDRVIGRLADLSVNLDSQTGPRLIQRLLVRCRRAPDLLLPWAVVETFQHSGVRVRADVEPAQFRVASIPEALSGDEILLVRDVLDTQIIDVVGRRLARVADVALSETTDCRLELIGVEVGFDAVLRRLQLPRLARHIHRDVVAWADLHLTSERGPTVQLATPLSAVHHIDAAGLAALVDRLDIESAAEILAVTRVTRRRWGDRLLRIRPLVSGCLRAMPGIDAAEIVSAMPAHHASRWRARLASRPRLLGRHFVRSRVWPRRYHAPTGESE